MTASYVEANFDGLVGPSHHYAGLAYGNEASMKHRDQLSNPRQAALQGLEKAWLVAQLGIPQGVLPPQDRPRLDWLRQLGFGGDDAQVLETVFTREPRLLSACYSASSMWAANAATVSSSLDTRDHRVHFTPANLVSGLHRSLEALETTQVLRQIFSAACFEVHDPLPASVDFRDEGAANHTRLAPRGDGNGLHVFVYGQDAFSSAHSAARKYPARQTRLASQSVARRHGLGEEQCLFLAQHPLAIDAGVFHNDVIAVGHEDLLLVHRQAFAGGDADLQQIQTRYTALHDRSPTLIVIEPQSLSLADAVNSYLFNSQIVTAANGERLMLCPSDCEQHPAARRCLETISGPGCPIAEVRFVDLRQSMDNGGGPACLRLRVLLAESEIAAVHPGCWLTADRYQELRQVILTHYRDRLAVADLRDPAFVEECCGARQALLRVLDLSD